MQQTDSSQRNWQDLFHENTIQTRELERDLNYHSPGFGIRALEYVVFVGSLLTLGLFSAALGQLFDEFPKGLILALTIMLNTAGLLLHRTVHNRLIDALATALCAYGVFTFVMSCLMYWKLTDETTQLLLIALMVLMILISRKNLLTILAVMTFFYTVMLYVEGWNPLYGLPVISVSILLLFVLFFLEETILTRIPLHTWFLRHIKTGLFLAISFWLVFNTGNSLDHAHLFDKHTKTSVYVLYAITYGLILAIAITVFYMQHKRFQSSALPAWTFYLIPIILIAIGWLQISFAFFILTLLSFLFTRYWFGVIVSVIGMVYSLLLFYHSLHWTFLNKSLLLLATGAVCLTLYFLLTAQLKRHD